MQILRTLVFLKSWANWDRTVFFEILKSAQEISYKSSSVYLSFIKLKLSCSAQQNSDQLCKNKCSEWYFFHNFSFFSDFRDKYNSDFTTVNKLKNKSVKFVKINLSPFNFLDLWSVTFYNHGSSRFYNNWVQFVLLTANLKKCIPWWFHNFFLEFEI